MLCVKCHYIGYEKAVPRILFNLITLCGNKYWGKQGRFISLAFYSHIRFLKKFRTLRSHHSDVLEFYMPIWFGFGWSWAKLTKTRAFNSSFKLSWKYEGKEENFNLIRSVSSRCSQFENSEMLNIHLLSVIIDVFEKAPYFDIRRRWDRSPVRKYFNRNWAIQESWESFPSGFVERVHSRISWNESEAVCTRDKQADNWELSVLYVYELKHFRNNLISYYFLLEYWNNTHKK